jgi:drug/metabolite transporter (DMT)-like permease
VSDGALASVSFGLAAAAAWGAGDFTGGLAAKRANVYGVVIGGQAVGLAILLLLALLSKETPPTVQNLALAGLAGIAGGFGLILLYRALAEGRMSAAAPISAVLAAAIPVLVSAVWQGLPRPLALAGLFLALLAIGLIARGEGSAELANAQPARLHLAFAAGVVFGLFFVLLHRASQAALFWPIIAARLASITFLTTYAASSRQRWAPQVHSWPLIALAGILDTAGNSLYVLSGQFGRLDVAAVLSSLYPAATVALAWLVLKERIASIQKLGIVTALAAIVLITV